MWTRIRTNLSLTKDILMWGRNLPTGPYCNFRVRGFPKVRPSLFELIRRLFSFFLSWLWVELGVWRTTRMPTFWIRFETRNVCFLAPRENWERKFVSQQGFTRLPEWLSLLKFGVFIENLAICVRFIRGPSCCWAENCFVNTKTVFAILFWNKSSQFV